MSGQHERAAQAKSNRAAQRLQLLLWGLDDWAMADGEENMRVFEIRVTGGPDRGGEWMVVAKGVDEGKRVVGFHSADTAEEAIRGCLNRIGNGQLKWKEDTPYKGA